MDIRNWGLAKIMRLPDWCFGRRSIVSCHIRDDAAAQVWDISELELPTRGVIWSVGYIVETNYSTGHTIRIGLGDQLPATNAEMMTLDPLIPGLGIDGPEPRLIYVTQVPNFVRFTMRQGCNFMGRRLVIEFNKDAQLDEHVIVAVEVSGIPAEIPDWLCAHSE